VGLVTGIFCAGRLNARDLDHEALEKHRSGRRDSGQSRMTPYSLLIVTVRAASIEIVNIQMTLDRTAFPLEATDRITWLIERFAECWRELRTPS